MVGIAETGSGKTMGYLVPAFSTIMRQPRTNYDKGETTLQTGGEDIKLNNNTRNEWRTSQTTLETSGEDQVMVHW